VAAPKECTNQDNHGHSRGLLVKVNKANRYFALSVDNHQDTRGSRTSPTTIALTIPSFHLISRTARTTPKTFSQTFKQDRSATMVT
jgi:hypothetical protein